jgi:hypothetical protein
MRKRFLIILTACVALAVIVIFIFMSLPSEKNPLGNIFNPSPDQGNNGTPSSWKFPNITFPWSSKPSGSGAGAGSGGSGGSGSKGGGSGGNATQPQVIKRNYTLFVNSTHNLGVLVIYTVNKIVFNETKSLPFSLDVQEDTSACLSETTGSGTIRWLMDDGSDCPFSDCAGGLYGCSILMNSNRSVTIRQYS